MRARVVMLGLLAGLALLGASPAPVAAVDTIPCAWSLRLDTNEVNTLYLDQSVTYWVARLPALPGSSLLIKGRFPHSRYTSFTTYDPRTRAIDSLFDRQVDPDPGSQNPFRQGVSRNLDARGYTVRVAHVNSAAEVPSDPPPDTLYASAPGEFFVVYRIYLADRSAGRKGGVPLPAVAYEVGGRQTPVPSCPEAQQHAPSDLNSLLANSSPPAAPFTCPGTNPPTWHRFYNFGTSLAEGSECASGPSGSNAKPLAMKAGPGGFLEDRENAYLFTLLNHRLGPVVVIQARPPSFPPTFNGESPLATGTNLRYWSYCTYNFSTQQNYACLFDQAVRLDSDGLATVVISAPADRPACALNWLPFGAAPYDVVILRNQLPQPRFSQSIQAAHEGSLQATMGDYFPGAAYTTRAAFEQEHGCSAAAAVAGAGTSQGSAPILPFSSGAGGSLPLPLLLLAVGMLAALCATLALARRR